MSTYNIFYLTGASKFVVGTQLEILSTTAAAAGETASVDCVLYIASQWYASH